MKIGVKVGDLMTRNFVSAKPGLPVLRAINLMVKNGVGSLILEEKGILKGILTESDIMWALSKKSELSNINAIDIATKKITTIRPSADVYDAIEIMKKAKFRRLPVTVKKTVIGYLTLKDILKIQPELFEIAQESNIIREHEEKLRRKEEAVPFEEGICEECENFDILYHQDGKYICESCREEEL